MSDLLSLLALLAPFFGLIAAGTLSARLARLPLAGLAWMQFFLVYLALPALLFRLVADKPIAESLDLRFAVLTTAATAFCFVLGLAVVAFTTRQTAPAVLGGVAASFANIGYMGPPLVLSFLGPAASAPVALILIFDTLFMFTAVPALMSFAGVDRRPPALAMLVVLRRIATHPFMVGTALGVLASLVGWKPPEVADRMLSWLAGSSAPCALFVLGVTVGSQPARGGAPDVLALVFVKLVVHPFTVWLLLSWFGDPDPVWAQAALVMAALPPALNIFVLSTQYGTGIERASACVLVGNVLSALTLTGLLWLLRTGTIPPLLFR